MSLNEYCNEAERLVKEGNTLDQALTKVKIMMMQQETQLNTLVREIHKNAVNHGFWEDWKIYDIDQVNYEVAERLENEVNNAIGNRLMLIVGEVSEAHEALRKGDKNNFKEEIADIVIRCLDLCGGLDIDIEEEIYIKMEINKSREYKHGKLF